MRRTTHHRRGSMYVVVLGASTAIAVIGLAALTSLRIHRRAVQDTLDFAQARLYAQSAVELGMFRIKNDANWRTTYPTLPNDVWEADQPIGRGSYTLEGVDPNDADITNNDTDPLVLTGIGMQGDARYKLQVRLVAEVDPIEALRTAIHGGQITVASGKSLTATGAPVSTDGLLQLDTGAVVTGDVEAASLSNGGTITGTVTVPSPNKGMPDPGVFNMYASLATPIAAPTTIDKLVLAPGYNPLGTANPDGVYSIIASGAALTITNSRIHGTLVVDNPGGTLVLDTAILFHNFRADSPVLVANCNVELLYPSAGNSLSESTLAMNFNPAGAPYQGFSDDLQDDTYPSEMQGLVHTTGTLRMMTSARVNGVVICESTVTADDANEIVYDPNLYTNPPVGYTTPPTMVISQGTWRQVVD